MKWTGSPTGLPVRSRIRAGVVWECDIAHYYNEGKQLFECIPDGSTHSADHLTGILWDGQNNSDRGWNFWRNDGSLDLQGNSLYGLKSSLNGFLTGNAEEKDWTAFVRNIR